MRYYFVGVSCVGKSTLGRLLAERYNYKFFDFDHIVMNHFQESIEAIKGSLNSLKQERDYRLKVRFLLDELLMNEQDRIIIAMPPSGLFPEYKAILSNYPDVISIALMDYPEAILKRLLFVDEHQNVIPNVVNVSNRLHYLIEIYSDMAYYGLANRSANLTIHLDGRDIPQSIKWIHTQISNWLSTHAR